MGSRSWRVPNDSLSPKPSLTSSHFEKRRVLGAIFRSSSQTQPIDLAESWLEELAGKADHVIGYAGLGGLWRRALAAYRFTSEPQMLAFLTKIP